MDYRIPFGFHGASALETSFSGKLHAFAFEKYADVLGRLQLPLLGGFNLAADGGVVHASAVSDGRNDFWSVRVCYLSSHKRLCCSSIMALLESGERKP